MQDKLIVKGARQHNLKNITVEIPRDKLVVITGLSGSGKSSLAFDTIYAEGQRRYVESLSAYARQFLGQMDKPEVDYIEGLIERGNTFTMEAFARSVNAFLEFNQYKVLEGSGSVSRCAADRKAGLEYDEFNRTQKIVSDFDREVKRLLDGDKPDDKGKSK